MNSIAAHDELYKKMKVKNNSRSRQLLFQEMKLISNFVYLFNNLVVCSTQLQTVICCCKTTFVCNIDLISDMLKLIKIKMVGNYAD